MNGSKDRWAPQSGPQLAAIQASWCTELFFGGARGGGKSDFLLGDFGRDISTYQEAWRGVLFRRTYPELEELIARSRVIYGSVPGAEYRERPASEWRFPGGATLKMRHLESDRDASSYIGHQYCVAVGTPILMADGSWKEIELIDVGESVATLEGPRVVTDTVRPYQASCVELRGPGIKQVHPVWHEVLASGGWQSYASLLGIAAKVSVWECLGYEVIPPVALPVKCAVRVPGLDIPGLTAIRSPVGGRRHRRFGETVQAIARIARGLWSDLRRAREAQLSFGGQALLGDYALVSNVESARTLVRGYRDDCLILRHYRDEQSRQVPKTGRAFALALECVGAHSREHSAVDVLGSIPSHSRLRAEYGYQHPYDGSARLTAWESYEAACDLRFVGRRMVADITVEDANHYITPGGVVNRNSWIGWDELSQRPSLGAYHMFWGLSHVEGMPAQRGTDPGQAYSVDR